MWPLGEVRGGYGPYQQSLRGEIYRTYVKRLVEEGKAYPCFCSEEQRQADREKQEERKLRTGYYGEFAHCRLLPEEEALSRVEGRGGLCGAAAFLRKRGAAHQV